MVLFRKAFPFANLGLGLDLARRLFAFPLFVLVM